MAKSFKVGLSTGALPTFSGPKRFRFFKISPDFTAWSKSATSDKYFRSFFFTWILPLLFISIFVVINFASLPNETPLFYSRLWGEAQLANKGLIFLPLGGTFLLGIFNLSLATNFHSKDRVLSYFLAGCASLVSLLSAITVFNIVNLMK